MECRPMKEPQSVSQNIMQLLAFEETARSFASTIFISLLYMSTLSLLQELKFFMNEMKLVLLPPAMQTLTCNLIICHFWALYGGFRQWMETKDRNAVLTLGRPIFQASQAISELQ